MFSFFHKKSSKKNQKPVKSANDLSEASTRSNLKVCNDLLAAQAEKNRRLSHDVSPFGYFTTGRFLDKKRSSQLPLGISEIDPRYSQFFPDFF